MGPKLGPPSPPKGPGPEEAGELGHWGQAMFALPAPRGLEKGDALRVRLRVRGSVLELLWPA